MTVASKRSSAPTDLDKLVSERVKSLRSQRRLRQVDMADQLGIVHQQYHKYEAGLLRISAGMMIRLAKILDCKVADLVPPELRGEEDLQRSERIDLLKQHLVDLILDSNSEEQLIAIKTILLGLSEQPDSFSLRIVRENGA